EALQEIAEQVLVGLGHPAPVSPVLTGVAIDIDCLQFVRAHPEIPDAWQQVASGEIPAVSFWYRQNESRLPRPALLGSNEQMQMLPLEPGAAAVRLDGRGKLLSMQVAASSPHDSQATNPPAWQQLFELAGLTWSDFHEVPVNRWPPRF